MLQKPVFALPGRQRMSVNTLLCVTLALAEMCCRHTVPDQTVKAEVKDRNAKELLSQYVLSFWGPFKPMIVCPDIKQKQARDRKTHFEALSLPVAKILSPVARQAPTKVV